MNGDLIQNTTNLLNDLNMKSVCIVGAGTMGAGIAQWFATNGIKNFPNR